MRDVLYVVSMSLLALSAAVIILCVWSVLPVVGLGGKLFLTLWMSGGALGVLSA